jgi:hypothetical protein
MQWTGRQRRRVTLCHRILDGSLTLNFATVYHFLSSDNICRSHGLGNRSCLFLHRDRRNEEMNYAFTEHSPYQFL